MEQETKKAYRCPKCLKDYDAGGLCPECGVRALVRCALCGEIQTFAHVCAKS